MPKRIQMTRQRPWRADNPDAVIVARPSEWGNGYAIEKRHDGWHVLWLNGETAHVHPTASEARAHAVQLFEKDVSTVLGDDDFGDYVREGLEELRGRDLACWCPLDQLLELANA